MIVLGLLLLFKAVNVPFFDQWELVPIIQHLRGGGFYVHDFWQQHNEHRLLFPRIFMVILASLTSWNTKTEAISGFVIAVTAFFILLATIGHSLDVQKVKRLPLLLPLLISIIWFSPVQWENWLWGWQLQWFMSVLGIMIVAYGWENCRRQGLGLKSYTLLIGGSLLAQYSLGNGLLTWPLLILALIWIKTPPKKVMPFIITAVFSTSLYYWNYTTPDNGFSKSYALLNPLGFIKFFFAYLGRPITQIHLIPMIAGFVLVVLFLALSAYALNKKPRQQTPELVWVILGMYAIASACITDVSRLGFGVQQAYLSRYTTVASLLLIATILLVVCLIADLQKRLPHFDIITSVSLSLLMIMLIGNCVWGFKAINTQHKHLMDIKACTRYTIPSETCLRATYPDTKTAAVRLKYLKQIHWAGY